jgi:broad specificity phosphatase PhoE
VPDIWLVRHGETEWSVTGQHTGRTDIPLTERGKRQAELLQPRLQAHTFSSVVTSPLRRARETCALAGFREGVQADPDLQEWDYGAYEGRTSAQIRAETPTWELWIDGGPGGESPEQIAARADRFLARIMDAQGDTVLFAHGHILRVLAARWLGLPAATGRHFALDTAAVSMIGRDRGVPVIRLWNDTNHLTAGRP